ncbi:MAG TPA: hypothetical protein VLE70_20710 [Anaerolineae bacterium]|nr:hypothetical protein [Anaerolineae bacterium]
MEILEFDQATRTADDAATGTPNAVVASTPKYLIEASGSGAVDNRQE